MKMEYILRTAILLAVCFMSSCEAPQTVDYMGPKITDIDPDSGYVNDFVIITGENFSADAEDNTVRFGEHIAAVQEASQTRLKVLVPNGSGEVNVTVSTSVAVSDGASFTFLVPTLALTSIEPALGVEGDIVILKGDNFHINPFNNLVQFGEVVADVVEASKTELKVKVPEGRSTVNVTVAVGRNKTPALPFTYTVAKTILSGISPASAFVGDEVKLKGAFKVPTENNVVTFGGVGAELVDSSDSELTVKVPTGTGTVDVIVTSADDSSEPLQFSYATIALNSISKNTAQVYDTLYLSGMGLSVITAENIVKFGSMQAEVLESDVSGIKVVVPPFMDDNTDVFVSVRVGENNSNSLDFHLLQYYTEVIAGNGTQGSSTTPVNAMDAELNQPVNLAFDSAGNLYIAESGGCTVRKLTKDGKIEFIAGKYNSPGAEDGTGINATFKYPYDLVVDASGNIYVADVTNKLIRKITPAGVVTTIAGSVTSASAKDGKGAEGTFVQPYSITMDNHGNLIVGDRYAIRKVTLPDGDVSTLVGDNLNAPDANSLTSFNSPRGLAVAPDGTIYVCDGLNNCIKKIAPDLTVTRLAGPAVRTQIGHRDGPGPEALFFNPQGLALAPDGNIFVSDGTTSGGTYQNYYLRKITPDGYVTTVMGMGSVTSYVPSGLGITVPYRGWGVAIDNDGNIYLPDQQHLRIRKVYLK